MVDLPRASFSAPGLLPCDYHPQPPGVQLTFPRPNGSRSELYTIISSSAEGEADDDPPHGPVCEPAPAPAGGASTPAGYGLQRLSEGSKGSDLGSISAASAGSAGGGRTNRLRDLL
jgi:hypothetical protein